MNTTHLKKISVASLSIALLGVGYFSFLSPVNALTSLSAVQPGDLIRGESLSAVYYMGADGMRYAFPNQHTFSSWYSDFDDVKFLSDADLAKTQVGGNVTYRPGVRMIKITTDPKTYAVEKGGVIRHVTSEAVAVALYGSNWNKHIDDVADVFFANYTVGTPIYSSADYNPASVTASVPTINTDKSLSIPIVVNITSDGYSPLAPSIEVGQTIRFVNTDTVKHTATAEDLSWGTGTLNPGDSFVKTFKKDGTYGFFDSYDSGLSGAIFVE